MNKIMTFDEYCDYVNITHWREDFRRLCSERIGERLTLDDWENLYLGCIPAFYNTTYNLLQPPIQGQNIV